MMYKMEWLLIICIAPLFGLCIYMMILDIIDHNKDD